jgi:hypothetical protein
MASRRKPDEIERQLERTRVEMDDTMRAIVEKVTPREWLDEASRYFSDTGTEYGRILGRSIMKNPLPLALTGIGISWLILAAGSSSSYTGERKRNLDPMKERYGQTMEKMQDAGGRLRERLGRMIDPLHRGAEEGAKGFRHREGTEGSRPAGVRLRDRKLGEKIRITMQEQPLAVGVLVFSIGAALGAILPLRREPGEMGKNGEQLAERAQEMASETGGAEEAGVEIQVAGGEEERSAENVSAL